MESTNPVRLAYDVIEPEDDSQKRSPIIFLHGFTACKEVWEDLPKKIASITKRKVYSVDARNHGDSEWSDVFDFSIIVDDFLNFLDTNDIQKCIVVGHSMGGHTAMRAARMQPDRFEKLIIEDIGVERAPPEVLEAVTRCLTLGCYALQQVPQQVSSATEDAALKFITEYVYDRFPPEQKVKTNPKRLEVCFGLKKNGEGLLEFRNNVKVLLNATTISNVSEICPSKRYEGPAHFIYGKLSPFRIGDQADSVRKYFPRADFIGIENAYHSVHNDCPEEYFKVLIKCVEEN